MVSTKVVKNMKKLIEKLEERKNRLQAQKTVFIKLADKHHEESNFADEDWYRTRAMVVTGRISEIEMILDMLYK